MPNIYQYLQEESTKLNYVRNNISIGKGYVKNKEFQNIQVVLLVLINLADSLTAVERINAINNGTSVKEM